MPGAKNKYLDSSLQAWPLVVLMKDSRDFVTSIMRIFLMIGMSLGEMISKVLTMQKNLLRTFLLLPLAR